MTSSLVRWALVLGLVVNAVHLHAQTTEEGAPQTAETDEKKMQGVPLGGIRYGAPLGASAYAGLMLSRKNPAGVAGPSLIAEAGQDGARVSLGVSSVSLAGTQRAQMSFIRTWDDRGGVRANQTYIGPEIAVGFFLAVTVGHYWRISDGGGKARIFAVGAALGL